MKQSTLGFQGNPEGATEAAAASMDSLQGNGNGEEAIVVPDSSPVPEAMPTEGKGEGELEQRQAGNAVPDSGNALSNEASISAADQESNKKLFALFNPGHRDNGASDPGPSKRSRPTRAAKDKKPCYVPLYNKDGSLKAGQRDEWEEAQEREAGSNTRKKQGRDQEASGTASAPPKDPPPPPLAPLPPLSLDVKGTTQAGDDTKVAAFFAKRPAKMKREGTSDGARPTEASSSSSSIVQRHQPKLLPLWPDRESVHVRPASDAHERHWTISDRPIEFQKRSGDYKGKRRAIESPKQSLRLPQDGLAKRVRASPTGSGLASTSKPMSSSQSSSSLSEQTTSALWTEQWRPRRADEVIGNKDNACYLRDWLHELKVLGSSAQGSAGSNRRKRPIQTVISKADRKSAKRPRRYLYGEEMEDFIVDSTDEGIETAEASAAEDDVQNAEARSADGQLSFAKSGRLTNCIVLAGPAGSGKTAAIYACAEELNFEIFELFPGMGQRGRKELHQAVGELSRNHMVSGGGSGGGAFKRNVNGGTNAFNAMMSSQASAVDGEASAMSPTPSSSAAGSASAQAGTARQSLILIEEADIIYEEDRGFWSGVVDLIASSRRPVVLTCNDLRYLPLSDIPVQEVLRWQLPMRESVEDRLSKLAKSSVVDAAVASNPRTDIRQALNQLQFANILPETAVAQEPPCDMATPDVRSATAPLGASPNDNRLALRQMRALRSASSTRSFSICHLARPFVRQSAGEDPVAGYSSTQITTISADEVLPGEGMRLMHQRPAGGASPQVLPLQGGEEELQSAVQEISATLLRDVELVGFEEHDGEALLQHLEMQRAQHRLLVLRMVASASPANALSSQLLRIYESNANRDPTASLDDCHDLELAPVPLLPNAASTSLDLAPFLRLMVLIDDTGEAQHAAELHERREQWKQLTTMTGAARRALMDAGVHTEALPQHQQQQQQQAAPEPMPAHDPAGMEALALQLGSDPEQAAPAPLSTTASSTRRTRNSNRFMRLLMSAGGENETGRSGPGYEADDREEEYVRLAPVAEEDGIEAARKSGAGFQRSIREGRVD
ncbi:unnamed protein product [Jaminaea pallidilutea]